MPEQKVVAKRVNIAEIKGVKDTGSQFSDAKEFVRLGNSLTAAGLDPEIATRTAESLGFEVTRSGVIMPFKPGIGPAAGIAEYPNSTVFFQEKPTMPKELPGLSNEYDQVVLRSQTLVQREGETVVEMVVLTPRKQDLIEEKPWVTYHDAA